MKKFLLTTLKLLVFFIGWAVTAGLLPVPCENDPVLWRFFAELIPFAVLAVFTAVFIIAEKGEVKIPCLRSFVKAAVSGTLTGALWIGAAVGIMLFTGISSITKGSTDISPMWFVSAFINVCMQELLIRGYIYQLLKTKYDLPAAVIFTTLLFTAMHGGAFEAGAVAVINVVTMSLFASAIYEAEGNIFAPIAAHAVWNLLGALVIGGVSLAEDYPHIYEFTSNGSKLLSGSGYKIEASIIVTMLNIILAAIFFIIAKTKTTHKEVSQ